MIRRCVVCGFTLIELLIVVAIIGVLTAILVPGMTAARQRARRMACQANLHTAGRAWHMYLGDHDGRFLKGTDANAWYGGAAGMLYPGVPPRPVNPYAGLPLKVYQIGTHTAFTCPSDDGGWYMYPPMPVHMLNGTSYATNFLLVGQARIPEQVQPEQRKTLHKALNSRIGSVTISEVSEPSRLVLMGDHGWADVWPNDISNRVDWHGESDTHNLLFVDGHVNFTYVQSGMYVTNEYRVLPFADLDAMVWDIQPFNGQR